MPMKVDLSKYHNRHGLKNKISRLLWQLVWGLFVRPTPSWALHGWRALLFRIFGAKIGNGVILRSSLRCWQPANLVVGKHCMLDSDVNLYAVDRIIIGDNCAVSEGAYLCTASHEVKSETFELKTAPIVLGNGVWVAAKAIILPGVTIGEGAVVAAGSVVAKDVAPWTIVGGNPARIIGTRNLKD